MKSTTAFAFSLALACVVLSGVASAAPTYLACTFMVDGSPNVIDFTADEAAGTVSILTRHSGFNRTVAATFTPERVLVNEGDVRWEISRVDLTVSSTITMINSTDHGKCEIEAAPKRAF